MHRDLRCATTFSNPFPLYFLLSTAHFLRRRRRRRKHAARRREAAEGVLQATPHRWRIAGRADGVTAFSSDIGMSGNLPFSAPGKKQRIGQ
jgi:hypothetical protein